jgi:vacuolar protein sorting-associated protein 13A/C
MMDSLSSAVQGVVVQPVEGFDREGGVGFAKGVAKGVAGYVPTTPPTVYSLTRKYS